MLRGCLVSKENTGGIEGSLNRTGSFHHIPLQDTTNLLIGIFIIRDSLSYEKNRGKPTI